MKLRDEITDELNPAAPVLVASATATLGLSQGLGIGLGQLLSGMLGAESGWRMPFLYVAIPGMVLNVLFLIVAREPQRGATEEALKKFIADEQGNAHLIFLPDEHTVFDSIDAIAAAHEREVTWRPIMLGAALKLTGGGPNMNLPLKGPYLLRDAPRSARGRAQGLRAGTRVRSSPVLRSRPSRLSMQPRSPSTSASAPVLMSSAWTMALIRSAPRR